MMTSQAATTYYPAGASVPNSGTFSDIYANGSFVAVAHKTTTNAIVLSYSNDGGQTWSTAPVTLSVAAGTTTAPIELLVSNGTSSFTIFYWTTANSWAWVRSTDNGFTWSPSATVPVFFDSNIGPGSTEFNFEVADADAQGDTLVFVSQQRCLVFSSSCNFNDGVGLRSQTAGHGLIYYYSADGGFSWSGSVTVIGTCTTNGCTPSPALPSSMAVWASSPSNFTLYYDSLQGPVTNGLLGTTFSTNDAFNTVSGYGSQTHTDHTLDNRTIAKDTGNVVYYGKRISSSAYSTRTTGFTTTGALSNLVDTGTRIGFAASLDTSNSVILYTSCDGGATWGNTIINGTGSFDNRPSIANSGNDIYIAYNGTGSKLEVAKNNDTTCPTNAINTPPTIPLAASTNIGGLLAFDVDQTGAGVLITKRDNGTNVSTLAPQTLTQYAIQNVGCSGTQFSVGRGGIDAVSVNSASYVAYNACGTVGGGGSTDVDEIRIRNGQLGSIDLSGCGYCRAGVSEDDDAAFGNSINLPDNMATLNYVEQYPYTFTEAGSQATIILFPFTEEGTGKFGIYLVKFDDNDIDSDRTVRVQFSSDGTTVSDICSWRSSATGRDYLAVSESATGLRIYEFEVSSLSSDPPTLTISDHAATPSAFQQATSISCAGNLIVASLTGSRVGAFYVDADSQGHAAGQIAWGPTSLSSPGIAILHNAATLSPSGAFAAYNDGSLVKLVNATSGEVLAQLTRNSGDLYGMKMDRPNNSLWIATGYPMGTLARYNLVNFTNNGTEIIDTNPNPSDTGSTSTSTTTPTGGATECSSSDGFFCTEGTAVPVGFTVDSFKFFLGILFLFAVAGGAYFALGKSPIAAGIGGAGGFLGGFAFGLFPLWAVLLVALACAAIFVLRFRGAAG